MKILLKFSTLNNLIPKDYRRVILSFFKKSLSEIADGKYYEKFYSSAGRRPFTFAVRLSKPVFEKEQIRIEKNEFQLVFSTGDNLTGFVFMSAFIAQKGKSFNAPLGNKIILKSITQLNDNTVMSDSALVKLQSPLCLREHLHTDNKDMYISVADNEFEAKAKAIISQQLINEGFLSERIRNFEIVPINLRKTVVFHYGCAIECSIGEFMINADKAVINYFLKCGIGSRKSSGFGMLSLVAEN